MEHKDLSATYRIGCCGYYYPAWKNKFYPAGLQPKNWLAYYSTIFNTVELNGTFYRMPKLNDLKKYAALTPENFTFSVKVSRFITHVNRLQDKQSVNDFQDLITEGLGHKVSSFLFQMPPSFHYSEENLDRIIATIPHHPHNVVELRHVSWWNKDVQKAFNAANLTFCNVDFPKLDSYIIVTKPEFYLRLHGNPILFASSYEQEQLEDFHDQFPKDCRHYSVYFNNTMYEAGYTNALQLLDIIHQNSFKS